MSERSRQLREDLRTGLFDCDCGVNPFYSTEHQPWCRWASRLEEIYRIEREEEGICAKS